MKDSKHILDLKKSAVGSKSLTSSGSSKAKEGFKFYHLLIMAILGLILGAYLSLNFKKKEELK